MKKRHYEMKSEIVIYPGMSGWRFLYIEKEIALCIQKDWGASKRGFGSIPVSVELGGSAWSTSIFPEKKSGTYILPLKAAIRKKEGIYAGDIVSFSITIHI